MRRAMIIGAGPGGLATALALQRAGVEAAVFERTARVREAGSGLTLWPNALKALEALGAADAVRSVCIPMEGIALLSWHGRVLSATPRPVMERIGGETSVALLRAELIKVLLDLVGHSVVRFDARCTGFRSDDAGVTTLFADGREERGDFLIGADGLRSVIAAQMFGASRLRYAGYPVWRGIAQFQLPDRIGVTSMGPGAQFGYFPMSGRRVYWFASVNAPQGSIRPDSEHKSALLDQFGGWHEPIRDIIEATDAARIVVTEIYDRKPLRRWGIGRVTLVGDAAHPSQPTLGQGACQAMEDAAVLGWCLRRYDVPPAALRAYERRRAPRANAMTSQARLMGRLGRWRRQPMIWLRECLIKGMPESLQVRNLRWIFQSNVN
jgi:2-polyprenyl-6-methoxyphenol hydroxylase-like FAD-dependent oxidoreductase